MENRPSRGPADPHDEINSIKEDLVRASRQFETNMVAAFRQYDRAEKPEIQTIESTESEFLHWIEQRLQALEAARIRQ